KATGVIVEVPRLDAAYAWGWPQSNLVGRHVVGGAYHLSGPAKLLDHLAIGGLGAHGLVLEAIAHNRDFARILAREIRVPVFLEPLGCLVADMVRGGEDAAGLSTVLEKQRAVILDRKAMRCG